jgi:hypothetical protein
VKLVSETRDGYRNWYEQNVATFSKKVPFAFQAA